jgi:hypothetical protein
MSHALVRECVQARAARSSRSSGEERIAGRLDGAGQAVVLVRDRVSLEEAIEAVAEAAGVREVVAIL